MGPYIRPTATDVTAAAARARAHYSQIWSKQMDYFRHPTPPMGQAGPQASQVLGRVHFNRFCGLQQMQ